MPFRPRARRSLRRRATLGFYYVLMAVFIAVGFGYVYYFPAALIPFIVCLFFLGIGGASFCVFTLWLPEQYPTECRASAFAFATSFGRFLAAGITFIVGAGVARMDPSASRSPSRRWPLSQDVPASLRRGNQGTSRCPIKP